MRGLYRRTGSGFQAKPETHICNNGLRLWRDGGTRNGLFQPPGKKFLPSRRRFLADAAFLALNL
jgi:hypothetical protein